MTDQERAVLKQALEALEERYVGALRDKAMDDLRAALAQQEPRNQCGETCERAKLCAVCARGLAQEQEPVAWMVYTQDGKSVCVTDNPADFTDEHRALPLYTHPPRREQEQEPVAWMLPGSNAIIMAATKVYRGALAKYYTQPLYTTPPRREWRGLTMQDINALPEVGGRMWNMGVAEAVLQAIRAVEAKLKEKNND
jgi:hypothetical protein